jgi:hypothetical protein
MNYILSVAVASLVAIITMGGTYSYKTINDLQLHLDAKEQFCSDMITFNDAIISRLEEQLTECEAKHE